MTFKIALLYAFFLVLVGCRPSLLFTKQQFSEVYSETLIPTRWQGDWSDNKEGNNYFIGKDTFYLGDLAYRIIPSKMDLGLDSSYGKDKLIFKDDWCFLSRYVQFDSTALISGYQVLVAHIDKKGSINCWEMGYDYFLKNQYVSKIPVINYVETNITHNGSYKKIDPIIVYADIPNKLNKKQIKRFVKSIPISTGVAPYFCDGFYEIEFFRNVARSQPPDLILTKTKHVIVNPKKRLERKYEKISVKNATKAYQKVLME